MVHNKTRIPVFFCFHYFGKQEPTSFWKDIPTPRHNQLHQAYFSLNQDGMSDQNR